jgi:hypothetical protein
MAEKGQERGNKGGKIGRGQERDMKWETREGKEEKRQ